jgi:hypothetical protein
LIGAPGFDSRVAIGKARAPIQLAKARSREEQRAAREMRKALEELEPGVARRFTEAVRALRGSIPLRDLVELVETRDVRRIEALLVRVGAPGREIARIVSLEDRLRGSGTAPGAPSFIVDLTEALRAGSISGSRQLPPREARLVGDLDLSNPEAIKYLRTTAPTQIKNISRESIDAIQDQLVRSFELGRPPIETARQIRGFIGLDSTSVKAVDNFRQWLETGEGPGLAPSERRLSGVDMARARSIMADPEAEQSRIDALVDRYSESLLNRRAQNIARTETHRALIEGQEQIWTQAEGMGLLDRKRTRRVWIVTDDERLRDSHAAIPGMNPNGVPLGQPFRTPFGDVDSPADENVNLINCRCTVALIFGGGLGE